MNYEEMSDFEINRAVACRLDGNDLDIFCRPMFSIDCYFSIPESSSVNWHRIGYESFNPCNNPSDAWPIINSIFWELMRSDELGVTEWAKRIRADDGSDKLRAAMIVFLIIRGGKCQKS